MKISSIHPNPQNPRIIKDDRFKKLVKSIQEFPKMMELRPIIVDNDGMILGGNMRFKALQELKYKDIPDEWVKRAETLTDEEKQRFIIEDNIPFGEWDWDTLANEWDQEQLQEWGLEISDFRAGASGDINPFNDEGITGKEQYGVIVICESAGTQEATYNDLMGMGYNRKIVVT